MKKKSIEEINAEVDRFLLNLKNINGSYGEEINDVSLFELPDNSRKSSAYVEY